MNDLDRLLIGEDHTWMFLVECVVRSIIMFVTVLLLFKFTGKKEVRQFSNLELIVIIGLGSAIGDPMLHGDTPLLPAIVAIFVILLLYRVMNQWTNRDPRVGEWVEGKVLRILEHGVVDRDALEHEGLSLDELFGALRTKHVEHLGQVKAAHMEVNGELSIFFVKDDQVRSGLPIHVGWADELRALTELPEGPVSCGRCGTTVTERSSPACPRCGNELWGVAVDLPRVA
jgi:uncharacterized membrane protein YcaP (DUF421 family)